MISDYTAMSPLLDDGRPRLNTPTIDTLLQRAKLRASDDEALRSTMIAAMRAAVERRVKGVTQRKRRNHYNHAASLAVTCAQADGSPESETWLHGLMDQYRRYSALKREFKKAGA